MLDTIILMEPVEEAIATQAKAEGLRIMDMSEVEVRHIFQIFWRRSKISYFTFQSEPLFYDFDYDYKIEVYLPFPPALEKKFSIE